MSIDSSTSANIETLPVYSDSSNEYIQVIYQNPNIYEHEENNFKSVFTKSEIKSGQLILLEHVLVNDSTNSYLIIENNEYLFDMSHPRTDKFSECSEENRRLQAIKKLSSNCFGIDGNKLLTCAIQKINHSCTPNCAVNISEKYNFGGTHIVFMELFSINNIPANTEITISYGPVTGHKRDFECLCGKSLEEREKIFSIVCGLSRKISQLNNDLIKKYIYVYTTSDLGKKIMLNHFLATKGIYINKDKIVAITESGAETINNLVYKYMKIKESDQTNKKITSHKIKMFMTIIHACLFPEDSTDSSESVV
ncbi:putative SET domain-containing protein [Acanthamoeba castellanii mimivirus]|nr:putative SET domain-containing protein [Acanthamoeba polyphaga mimivirus]AHA45651.1 putative SET domain-containing protein [Hirudovirus strain Sangsue]ALR83784.1 putative SET domain-containing protein [Niemeyer virus]AMK61812.1 set domain-containing protein [Samba virus]AMZ02668.1 putative SET domain-containing protein L222 [Mimivirus Bombay]BAV61312.1 putative SET domain-containing protein [Acanthamoeba castellanii mimivirus]